MASSKTSASAAGLGWVIGLAVIVILLLVLITRQRNLQTEAFYVPNANAPGAANGLLRVYSEPNFKGRMTVFEKPGRFSSLKQIHSMQVARGYKVVFHNFIPKTSSKTFKEFGGNISQVTNAQGQNGIYVNVNDTLELVPGTASKVPLSNNYIPQSTHPGTTRIRRVRKGYVPFTAPVGKHPSAKAASGGKAMSPVAKPPSAKAASGGKATSPVAKPPSVKNKPPKGKGANTPVSKTYCRQVFKDGDTVSNPDNSDNMYKLVDNNGTLERRPYTMTDKMKMNLEGVGVSNFRMSYGRFVNGQWVTTPMPVTEEERKKFEACPINPRKACWMRTVDNEGRNVYYGSQTPHETIISSKTGNPYPKIMSVFKNGKIYRLENPLDIDLDSDTETSSSVKYYVVPDHYLLRPEEGGYDGCDHGPDLVSGFGNDAHAYLDSISS